MVSVRRAAAVLLVLCFSLVALAGCVTDTPEPGLPSIAGDRVGVYEYRFGGDDLGAPAYGWLARVTNHGVGPVFYDVVPYGAGLIRWGLATAEGITYQESEANPRPDGAQPPADGLPHVLAGGASALWLFETVLADGANEIGFAVLTRYESESDSPGTVRDVQFFDRNVTGASRATRVTAGSHVYTATVGVWINGTSFYTNIAEFAADAAFPVGFPDPIDGEPLPVYVYDQDRSEQPAGSRDRCFFTTIPGYNALLKTQADGSTGARYLAPEEAYTREGNEDHDLYGDALIFLNRIVRLDPAAATDIVPDPLATCFDPSHVLPVPPPVR